MFRDGWIHNLPVNVMAVDPQTIEGRGIALLGSAGPLVASISSEIFGVNILAILL